MTVLAKSRWFPASTVLQWNLALNLPCQPAAQIQPSATSSQSPQTTLRHPLPLQHCEAAWPQPPIMMTTSTSQVCQNFHQDLKATINFQINGKLYTFYIYLSMSYYFDHDDMALKNFAKCFLHQSHKEREHTEKLMKLQNQWGGRIFLQDIKKPDCDDWENGLNTMEGALHLEKSVDHHYWTCTDWPLKKLTLICVSSLGCTTWMSRWNTSKNWVTK